MGRNTEQIRQLTRVFNRAMLIALGLTLVLAAVGGIFMSTRVLNRISAFTATTAEIISGRLDRRLATCGGGDEFDVPSPGTSTLMVERLESLVAAVRHVSDVIAHDLRTPLTRLRNRIELAARSAPDELRAELEGGVAEADELLATFSSLLRIARIESGSYSPHLESVDLPTMVADAVELYQDIDADKNLVVVSDCDPDLRLTGDRHLLFQALANLLDNAVKYAPPGTSIAVDAHRVGNVARLVVADSGPGISAADHERVTQRFARLDDSRSLPGSGLGLSLVQAVVDMHGGTLSFLDNAPGLRVCIELPLPAGPSPK